MKNPIVYGWDHNGIEEPEHKASELEEFKIQNGEKEEQPPAF